MLYIYFNVAKDVEVEKAIRTIEERTLKLPGASWEREGTWTQRRDVAFQTDSTKCRASVPQTSAGLKAVCNGHWLLE